MTRLFRFALFTAVAAAVVFAESPDVKSTVVKHLKVSKDFTVKVAQAMPESDYTFKLTPPQMSFGEQMVHLSQGLDYILSPFTGAKPDPGKPASMNKADVIAFINASYDKAINQVSQLTSEQLAKSYKSEEGTSTGSELLMMALDHSTHHRASAEMYLRSKGITPPEYEF